MRHAVSLLAVAGMVATTGVAVAPVAPAAAAVVVPTEGAEHAGLKYSGHACMLSGQTVLRAPAGTSTGVILSNMRSALKVAFRNGSPGEKTWRKYFRTPPHNRSIINTWTQAHRVYHRGLREWVVVVRVDQALRGNCYNWVGGDDVCAGCRSLSGNSRVVALARPFPCEGTCPNPSFQSKFLGVGAGAWTGAAVTIAVTRYMMWASANPMARKWRFTAVAAACAAGAAKKVAEGYATSQTWDWQGAVSACLWDGLVAAIGLQAALIEPREVRDQVAFEAANVARMIHDGELRDMGRGIWQRWTDVEAAIHLGNFVWEDYHQN